MRRYTTEDRSLQTSSGGYDLESAKQSRKTELTLQGMEYLTDFTADVFDQLADMKVGEEKLVEDWLYIKRTQ
jgi:hypothetical protein